MSHLHRQQETYGSRAHRPVSRGGGFAGGVGFCSLQIKTRRSQLLQRGSNALAATPSACGRINNGEKSFVHVEFYF